VLAKVPKRGQKNNTIKLVSRVLGSSRLLITNFMYYFFVHSIMVEMAKADGAVDAVREVEEADGWCC
jgi:hypothetical protein